MFMVSYFNIIIILSLREFESVRESFPGLLYTNRAE